MILSLIAAYAEDDEGRLVIGKDNSLPWHLPQDLRRFRDYTSGNIILMGRKTHESIGRVLPNRTNLILTRQENYRVPGAFVFHDLEEALGFARKWGPEAFVIGGQQVYDLTIDRADRLYLTKVFGLDVEGDTFFPSFDYSYFKSIYSEKTERDFFQILQRVKRGDEEEPDSPRSSGWTETIYPIVGADPYDPNYTPIPGSPGGSS